MKNEGLHTGYGYGYGFKLGLHRVEQREHRPRAGAAETPLLDTLPQKTNRQTTVGSLCEYIGHDCLKTYVCVLYCSPCAPLMAPWLGELEGTSLAIA